MNISLAGKKINKDYINENFDNYDLRGTDFSGVNITGSKFCGALLGRTLNTTRWLLLLQSILLLAASYFVVYGNAFAAWFIEVQLKAFDIYSGFNLFFIFVFYALGFSCAIFLSVKYKKWAFPAFFSIVLIVAALAAVKAEKVVEAKERTISTSLQADASTSDGSVPVIKSGDKTGVGARAVDGPAAVAGAIVGAGLGTLLVLVVVASILAGSGADRDTKVRNLFIIVSIVGAGISVWGFTYAIGDSIAKGKFEDIDVARGMAEIIAWAGAGSGLVFMLFGLYLGNRASKDEESEFLFLRHFGVELNAIGGTEFANTTLHDCDFSGVDLKHVRFINAVFQGCNFRDAKNAHLASTRDTPLEFKNVRELVINRKLPDNKFDRLDLKAKNLNQQGLDFSNLDLRNADFSNANISFADFTNCDLRGADLSEVNAIGTRFNGCKLTGACIEHWNIDSRTELHGIDCDFVYTHLNPKQRNSKGEFEPRLPIDIYKDDKFERNPLNGKFAVGDFTKIYKEIADTIEYIAHSRADFNALIKSVSSVNVEVGGESIVVQDINFKEDGSIVVKVKADPKLDRKKIDNRIRDIREKKLKEALGSERNKNISFQENIRDIVHDITGLIRPIGESLNNGLIAISQNNMQQAQIVMEESSKHCQTINNAFKGMTERLKCDNIKYSGFNIHELAEEVIKENLLYANNKNVKLCLSKKRDSNIIVHSDRYYTSRILSNLVNNSIKYADISKGDLATVTIDIISHKQSVCIDVIDNGLGIPLNDQESIWEDGVRVDNTERNIEGSGFGLFFIRNKINELNKLDGITDIKLKTSKEGLGTRFSLRLPKGEELNVDKSASTDLDYSLDGLYVLLVENDVSAKKSWVTLLEANGAKYKVVNSVEELRALLPTLERYPDIVVTDYRLPNNYCTAVDVITELKKEFTHDIPTLILADETTDLDIVLQGNTILRNPVEEKQLLAEINFLGSAELE